MGNSLLAGLVDERRNTRSFFDTGKLDGLTKWAAAGFTALLAVLTFFGVKEGVLGRLLRADPAAALWVFVLVGLGVVCAALAPAIHTKWNVEVWAVLAAIALLALPTVLLVRDLPEEDTRQITDLMLWVSITLWILALVLLGTVRIALIAGVLVVAVVSVSLGLYGAAKLSVLSELDSAQPRVTAQLSRDESGDSVTVSVAADRQDEAPLYVDVVGTSAAPSAGADDEDEDDEDEDDGVPIGWAVVPGDTTGSVDASLAFPVASSAWLSISVRVCAAASSTVRPVGDDENGPCDAGDEVAVLSAGRGLSPTDALAGSFATTETAGQVQGTLSGSAMPPGTVLVGLVYRLPPAGTAVLVARAQLAADNAGALTWTTGPLTGAAGERVELRTVDGAPIDGDGAQAETTVASFSF